MAPTKVTSIEPIHAIYRLIFLYLEPFFAVGGTIQMLFSPLSCLAIDHTTLNAYLTSTTLRPAPSLTTLQPLFTMIAGGWLMLSLNDLVTLRAFRREPRVWWYIMLVHLASDVIYELSLAQDAAGGWWQVVNPGLWSREEWLTAVLTYPFTVAKLAFLLGVGVDFGMEGKLKV